MSEWRESANKRRDARHTKGEIRRPGGSKKNTKKWCRGVEGRAHKPECRPYQGFAGWRVLVCTECGKHLDHYWPPLWYTRNPPPKPDWVTG